MGVWDSIVGHASNIASWLGNNSGNIVSVISALAPFVAVASAEEAEEASQSTTLLQELYHRLGLAGKALEKYIRSHIDPPTKSVAYDGPTVHTSGPFDLVGMWINPVTVDNGNAPLDATADIATFLDLHKLPLSVTYKDQELNLAQSIGQKLFAEPDPSAADPELPIVSPPAFDLDLLKETGIRITGRHAYYTLPIGNGGSSDTWHGHVRLYAQKTPEFVQKEAERAAALEATLKVTVDPPASIYNSTTLTATWYESTLGIRNIMEKAVKAMAPGTPGATFTLADPGHGVGNSFTYTFWTKPEVGPAAVASALSSNVRDLTPKSRVTKGSSQEAPPAQPSYNIDNMRTLTWDGKK
jgi:hypothetical protein